MGAQHSAKLSPGTLQDLVETTNFSDDEVQKWYRGFRKDCPNGVLNKESFRQVYANFFPYGDATKFTDYAFDAFDTDRDGTINFQEFICALSITTRGNIEQRLKWAFNMYDLDKNGYISREEMIEIVKSIYKMVGTVIPLPKDEATPEMKVDKMFGLMDTNSDGNLSLDEFIAGAKQDESILKLLEGKPDV